jgi:hypothetical protein
MDKVAFGQVSSEFFLFSHVNIIPPWLSAVVYMKSGAKNRPAGGRIWETSSHTINTNKNMTK